MKSSEHAEGQLATWAAPDVSVSGRRIIRRAELQRLVPFSAVHIWRLEHRGEFPLRVQLGPNSVGWYADEVARWVAASGPAARAEAGCYPRRGTKNHAFVDTIRLRRGAPRPAAR